MGLKSTSYDPEFEIMPDLETAKHVDDVNMTGKEARIDTYVAEVSKVFGECKVNKPEFTSLGVRLRKLHNGDVTMDQDEYIKTLRPIVSTELTGALAEALATKDVASKFVSLRGGIAYTTLTQSWVQLLL